MKTPPSYHDAALLQIAKAHLSADPILAQVIIKYPDPVWQQMHHLDIFSEITETIIGQQLSNRVADVIIARFRQLVGQPPYDPATLLTFSQEDFRQCGLSYAKARSILGLATAVVEGQFNPPSLLTAEEAEVHRQLIALKGIGPWTADMLLIFVLQKMDVFSIGDLGLRTAVSRLYGINRDDLPAILAITEAWSPYRSLASRYLWLSLENQ